MKALLLGGMWLWVGWASPPAPTRPEDDASLLRRIRALEQELTRVKKQLAERSPRMPPAAPGASAPVADPLESLEKDYRELVRSCSRADLLRQARRCFARGDTRGALERLRRARALAGVPLILQDMLQAEQQARGVDLGGHLLALTLLTGQDLETRWKREGSVSNLVARWWVPNRGKITTEPETLTAEQWTTIASRLRDLAPVPFPEPVNGPSYTIQSRLQALFAGSTSDPPPNWLEEELHPALVAHWLGGIGYNPRGAAGHDPHAIPYQLVPLLASLRRNGGAPQLDKVARDVRQNSAVRLTCLLALHATGEGVRVPTVLLVLAGEKKLERRLVALELLHYAEDLGPAAPFLLESLDDPNVEVRRSTLNALGRNPPAALLPRLKKMAEKKHDEQLLTIIAAMRTRAARQYLADYLERTLSDGPKTERIHDALWAFQSAVEKQWIVAGRSPFAYYHEQATTALKWWKEHKEE